MSMLSFALVLGFLGLFFGSFAGAMVWRLRALQLREDRGAGEPVTKAESTQVRHIKRTKLTDDRSVCLKCGHRLAWFDLIPIISWLQLGGKCRYCHKAIGWTEPLLELSVSTFFVVSYIFWPYPLDSTIAILQLALWMVAGVGLAILFVYDSKWFLLPDRVMFVLVGLAALFSLTTLDGLENPLPQLMNIGMAVIVLSGLYYLIYVFSRHQWVGFGDVKLGLVLALLLADWRLALLALFLANLVGTLVMLPMMLSGKLKRGAHVPFGPFLIAGWLLSGLFGAQIIDWYLLFTLGST